MEVTQYRDTGELSDLTVNVSENEFKLHKFPLYIKSEYFKQNAQDKDTLDLEDFPGGKATFSLVADFCYGKPIDFTLGNITGLRNAAEFLVMKGSGNLITVTEKYIEDILNSAKLSRSVAPIMEILVQCDELGEDGDIAKVGQQCFNTIVDIWMRPFSRFSSPMDSAGRGGRYGGDYVGGGSNSYEDNLITDRLVNMPLKWLLELIKACGDHESKLKGLADLIYKYLAKVFTEVDKKSKGKKKKPKKNDEDGEEEEPEPEEKDEEDGDNPGVTLDTVIMALPEATPLADLITVDWIRRALEISEEYNCECKERLLQLAGNVLHKFSNEELKQIPSATLCEIIDNTIRNEKVVPEVLAGVLDNYMSELAKKKNLSVDDFVKLVNCIPENYRINHDTLFDVLEVLLTSGEEIPDEQRKELLDAVDLSRCHEDTLQRALEKNIIPVRDLCQAAINLASRLRKEKEEPERVPKYTDDIRPMRGNYSTSPRYAPSYGAEYDTYGRYGASKPMEKRRLESGYRY